MTELYIDGHEVVLPEDLNLKVKYQNPFFTKNGVFTLEITLSLLSEENAIIYRHIERLHSAQAIEGRKARLLVDGKTILSGTEVILSNTDTVVNIQLVSGNSEFNYFTHQKGDISELYISDLDLGSEDDLSAAFLNSILDTKYPQAAFAPARIFDGDIVLNGYAGWQMDPVNDPYPFANIAMQPYLLTLLVRTVEALGYAVEQNDLLDDDAICRLFIVSDVRDNRYSRMLPGWTVKEFLEGVERFLNITFDINPVNRSVRIVKNSSGVTIGKTFLQEVIDSYEREDVDDESALLDYTSVKYPLPDDDWYRYQAISEDIMNMADIQSYNTYDALLTALQVDNKGEIPEAVAKGLHKTMKVFYTEDYDTHFIVDQILHDNGDYILYWFYLQAIDRFDMTKDGADALELVFCPAQIVNISFLTLSDDIRHQNVMPSIEGHTTSEAIDNEEITDLTKLIEGGIPDEDNQKKKVFLAFYTGSLPGYERSDFAIDYLQELPFCVGKYDSTYLYTLRLNGPGGWAERYYRANNKYDFTKEYTFRFLHDLMPDVRSEFIIHNKRFVCKEMEYVVTVKGLLPEITGTFYTIK